MPKISGEDRVCYYCGCDANTVDHVIPQSTLKQLKILDDPETTKKTIGERTLLVWACPECNSLAGKSLQDNITQRKQFILAKLRKKYRKYLETPYWSDEELSELAPDMQQYIRTFLYMKSLIKIRLGISYSTIKKYENSLKRECLACGGEFIPISDVHRYCSYDCRYISMGYKKGYKKKKPRINGR